MTIGINVSGAEYSWMPFASSADLDYLESNGVTLIRLPISWERMQPTLNGSLDQTYLTGLKNFLSDAAAHGMQVIVDLHNYGRYNLNYAQDAAANYGITAPNTADASLIGSAAVPISAFANFWGQLAGAINGQPGLAYYDIMNEPYNMGSSAVWPAAAQAAVNAIRAVDMNTNVLVEGTQWASAYYWPWDNGNLLINDPANKLLYEAHLYFDGNGGGSYRQTYDQSGAYPNIGVDNFQPFLDWLSAHNAQGFIGEFGVPGDDPRWQIVLDNFMNSLDAHGISGTMWTYVYSDPSGKNSWWPNSKAVDPMNIKDTAGLTQPQMDVLSAHSAPTNSVETMAPDAPVISSFSPDSGTVGDGITSATILTLTGTAEANSTVHVFDGGKQLGTVAANGSGTWSFNTGTLAANATHNFTATDIDAAGNTSTASPVLNVTVDTVTPDAPVISSFSPDSGAVGDGITNATILTLTGTAEANSTVHVFDGGKQLGTAAANGSGTWSFNTGTLAANATHNFTATDIDAAGNTSTASPVLNLIVDTAAVDVVTPANMISVRVSGDEYQGLPQFRLLVDGKQVGGIHTVTANHNLGQWETVDFGFDASSPLGEVKVEFLNDAWGGTAATDRNLYVNSIEINGATLSPADALYERSGNSTVQGQTNMAWSGALVFNVADHNDLVVATSVDTVVTPANMISVRVSGDEYHGLPQFRLLVDGKQVGGIHTVTANHNLGQWETVDFGFDASSPLGEVKVEFLNDAWGGTAATDRNLYVDSIEINGATLSPADALYERSGNSTVQGQTNMAWSGALVFNVADHNDLVIATSVDTTAPDAPVISSFSPDSGTVGDGITSATILTLTGTAEANSTVHVFDGGKQLGTVAANGSGTWSFNTGTLAANATHNFTATDIDAAGNTSTASPVLTVTVDTVTPTLEFKNVLQNSNGSVTLTGSSQAHSAVSVYDSLNTKPLGTVTSDANGTWSFTTKELSSAIHSFTVNAVDAAGNTSAGSGAAISGTTHSDTINMGPGNDLVTSYMGNDTFVFASSIGNDIITDFQPTGWTHDVLQFGHEIFSDFSAALAHAAQVGSDVVITVDAADTVTLQNVHLPSLQMNDFHIV